MNASKQTPTSPKSTSASLDVLIVGGGMVGCAAALLLAEQGKRVMVLERFEPKSIDAASPMGLRVSALNLASEQLLAEVGCWSDIAAVRVCPYRRLAVWEDQLEPVEFRASDIEQSHLGHIVENELVQMLLWQRCQQHPLVDCRLIQAVESLSQSDEWATLTVDGQLYQAQLILACDGGLSRVRQLAGIGVEGWQYQQHALVVGIDTQTESQDITWQQMSATGPKAFLPLAQGKGSLVWYHQADKVARLKQLPTAQLKSELLQAFPAVLGDFTIEQVASFPLTRQHAQTYSKGRVVLVGDSAHLINPLAGQGVNLGFRDVRALAAVMADNQDWASSETLKRYQQQRKRDNLTMMSAMDAIYATFSNDLPPLKLARQLGLSLVNKLPIAKRLATEYACGLK
ncbi:2-octaprenyl-3-methyl-6-methoxy-1,4-benzoquinol hydroxylase [Neiella marina]|uniref:2-octaprenyl-3-methyl-6-methoxy-1,4-benzoquinol hydroxylase n=1 Tax=Neiella marina TaxID=508461 RepID=A0A8J2XP68_9GAMM|nr:FAD-dependent oxidoreductase [Neiella marina]GGA78766.1 2-octaprenyl-3-methyl-6-methoxy-1,4-benzoquinol hydroxylase [Neiella marina]